MATKFSKSEIEEAKSALREIVKPGDTIYTVIRHVSRSGMYRAISLYAMQDGKPRWIDYYASKLLEGYDEKHEACRASGCGMDMCFHLVYNLGRVLFPNGFDLQPGQYGRNGDTSGHDNDGGYALKYSNL